MRSQDLDLQMADILVNFSCSSPDLSRDSVTDIVWRLASEGPSHEHGIVAMATVLIVFLLIGIPWNTIVIIVIAKKGLYKEPTYILLLNLIFADLLVYVFVMPFNIASAVAMEFTIGSTDYARCQVCHTITCSILCLVFVSLFSLALMSLDRLIYIKWPITYAKYISVKAALVAELIVWIFCIIISIFPALGIGEIKYANVLSSCSLIIGGETHVTSNINYIIILVLVGLFPFMTALIANVWLLVLVCKTVYSGYNKTKDTTKNQSKDPAERKNSNDRLKMDYHKHQIYLAQVFGAIFAANVITWIPTIFISLVSAAIGTERVPAPAFTFMFLAFVSQPAIHPILETCLLGRARNTIWKCLCICGKKKNWYSRNQTQSQKISHSNNSQLSSSV